MLDPLDGEAKEALRQTFAGTCRLSLNGCQCATRNSLNVDRSMAAVATADRRSVLP